MGTASSPGPQRSLQTRHSARLAGRQAEPASGAALDLVALVAAAEPGEHDGDPADLGPEDRRILDSCREPVTVAEVASATALPVSVVRARLADLIRRGRITLQPQPSADDQPGSGLLSEVLDGLRTL